MNRPAAFAITIHGMAGSATTMATSKANEDSCDRDGDESSSSSSSLLTRKALEASLSPPRVPPHGSAHRDLLLDNPEMKMQVMMLMSQVSIVPSGS